MGVGTSLDVGHTIFPPGPCEPKLNTGVLHTWSNMTPVSMTAVITLSFARSRTEVESLGYRL